MLKKLTWNNYIIGIIAIIYGVLFIASGILYYFHIYFVLYVMIALWLISILLVVVKIVTKKYELFYFEPAMDSSKYDTNPMENMSSEDDLLLGGNTFTNDKEDSSVDLNIENVLKSLEGSDEIDDDGDLSKFD